MKRNNRKPNNSNKKMKNSGSKKKYKKLNEDIIVK